MYNPDTIIALATSPAESAVGLIRLSGKDAVNVVSPCFQAKRALRDYPPRQAVHGRLIQPDSGEVLDDVLVTVFPAPHSYTGEEVVEISGHGNPLLLREIIELLITRGARMASPGEFTQRAYLNDKMDLTRAEAVNDLIRAHTRYARVQALSRLEGGLSRILSGLQDQILDALSLLEVAIDHSDEELDFEHQDRIRERLRNISQGLNGLLSTARAGRILSGGMRVALVGTPNAGKSSLMNALLREDRVIVTDIPGTTRDVVEDELNILGIPVRMQDTAGIRESADIVEQKGVERSRRVLEQADLRLLLIDASRPLSPEDQALMEELPPQGNLFILTKTDLPAVLDTAAIISRTNQSVLRLSSLTGEGIPALEQAIRDFYFSLGHDPEQEVMLANIRQEDLLRQAEGRVAKAIAALDQGMSEEFVAADLRQARTFVEEVTGKSDHEAILDRIFSRFCIGK